MLFGFADPDEPEPGYLFGMPRSRPRLRRAAALLAWVGLLALPMRTIAACPMLGVAGVDGSVYHRATVETQMSDAHAEHDEHAGHGARAGHGMPDANAEAPSAPESPAHEACPDLAHCAVAAIALPLTLPAPPTVPVAALRIVAWATPLSAARALEPPPPKG